MNKRLETKSILLAIAVVAGATFLAGASAITIWYRHEMQLPVYTLDYQGFTLSLGDRTYNQETTLVPLSGWHGWRIGKTQGDLDIFGVGNEPQPTYLVMRGFMFPDVVYRDKQVPAWDILTNQVDELRFVKLAGLFNTSKSNESQPLIQEVVQSLTEATAAIAAQGQPRADQLFLTSRDISGMGYSVYVVRDDQGKLYFVDKDTPSQWIPAGPLCTDWINE